MDCTKYVSVARVGLLGFEPRLGKWWWGRGGEWT